MRHHPDARVSNRSSVKSRVGVKEKDVSIAAVHAFTSGASCLHYSVASMGNISNPATWNKVGWPSEYAGLTVAQGTSWNAKSARLKVIKMPLYIPWQGCALMV